MSFENLNLIEPILKALKTEGYTTPTPIQEQAIPFILQHRDLLGCAQTGTGKTAAFAIPILQLLFLDKQKHKEQKSIKALILTPTRELAIQISESFTAYGKNTGLKNLVIFGGVSQNPQVDALRRGVDILIATPGRLLDLMNQRHVHLDQIKMLILDEADRMLDMGFVHDVKKIIAKVPQNRQTLFFSATMPNEIQSLADSILQKPAKVEVAPVSSTADTIQQSLYFVEKNDKRLLLNHILKDKNIKTALVFTRTKHGADKVVKDLVKAGITAEAIHGNKSQNARQRALTNFKNRTTRVLIATDIAARGIDIDELTHVINYEIPNIPETYVHRIGRTGRAGASGIALTFCDGEEEIDFLKDVQKLIAKDIPVQEDHPYPLSMQSMTEKLMSKAKNAPAKGKSGGGGGRSGGGNKRPGAGGRPSSHRGGGSPTNSRGGASGMSGASKSSGQRRRD
ncbi:DEAD/DEAH box helicase [Mucilaginibacter glaciei]|uniref:DEAD-box ATP-dependent RNA helicase RhpA n=1 Tax=Mucilaginibacter glaciei TaxID=2772109 RepID=A0A926NPR5_9SPHI|nr:DEAD/DEAH box helicase [Mucilaginibacter glaciei]MBD1393138.1 DEAD/DEAH box helicase [Mucilaginibacter glaciei]